MVVNTGSSKVSSVLGSDDEDEEDSAGAAAVAWSGAGPRLTLFIGGDTVDAGDDDDMRCAFGDDPIFPSSDMTMVTERGVESKSGWGKVIERAQNGETEQ